MTLLRIVRLRSFVANLSWWKSFWYALTREKIMRVNAPERKPSSFGQRFRVANVIEESCSKLGISKHSLQCCLQYLRMLLNFIAILDLNCCKKSIALPNVCEPLSGVGDLKWLQLDWTLCISGAKSIFRAFRPFQHYSKECSCLQKISKLPNLAIWGEIHVHVLQIDRKS